MRVVVGLAAFLALAACAPTMKMSNSAGGLVEFSNRYDRARALAMADDHCKSLGKVAKVTDQSNDVTFTTAFECVAP